MTEHRLTPRFIDHPFPHLPGWVMADMARMAAGEIGDPIALFVLMKSDDRLFHVNSIRDGGVIRSPGRVSTNDAWRNAATMR